ncbi:Serralysin precursor [compost metagenome]
MNFVSEFTGHAGDAVLVYISESNESSLLVDLVGNRVVDFAVGTVGQALATDIIA